jgi:hypothetical protein
MKPGASNASPGVTRNARFLEQRVGEIERRAEPVQRQTSLMSTNM